MRKRIPKKWRRLVAEFERGRESRREFCERRALALSTLDYWRRRSRAEADGRLVEVDLDPGGALVGGAVAPVVITWPNGVRVELGADAVSAAVVGALHGALGGGGSCWR